MKVLKEYEEVSRQLINKEKSNFDMFHKVGECLVDKVEHVAGSSRGEFAFKYLVCPKFHNRKMKEYYSESKKEEKGMLQKATFKVFLIYLLSDVIPTKYNINDTHKVFSRIWSTKEEERYKHWVSWSKLCLPKKEGCLSFRSLYDISKAPFTKL